jgi:hypothetical protein
MVRMPVDFNCGRCWVCYEGGGKGIGDGSHGGQPAMAAIMETGIKFNRMIQDDCITTSELCTKIRIGKFVMAIIKVLGSEQFAHCVCQKHSPLNTKEPTKHIFRTLSVWCERQICFSVKHNYWY